MCSCARLLAHWSLEGVLCPCPGPVPPVASEPACHSRSVRGSRVRLKGGVACGDPRSHAEHVVKGGELLLVGLFGAQLAFEGDLLAGAVVLRVEAVLAEVPRVHELPVEVDGRGDAGREDELREHVQGRLVGGSALDVVEDHVGASEAEAPESDKWGVLDDAEASDRKGDVQGLLDRVRRVVLRAEVCPGEGFGLCVRVFGRGLG